MLNSAEHEINPAHECLNANNCNNCWHFNIYLQDKVAGFGDLNRKISIDFGYFSFNEQFKFDAQYS